MQKKGKVFVAMSGGVDSSVAAGLLVRQGYDVAGITLVFKPAEDSEDTSWCSGNEALDNARAVCGSLGIEHYAVNCAKEFEDEVLRPSWETYKSGRTPSPCILCNSKIKFRIIMEKAKEHGAEKLATGHYAIIEHGAKPALRRGEYSHKDQTYFLFTLNKEQLNFTLFPLGKLRKPEVRDIAREMGFANAERKESQDACFISDDANFQEALRERFNAPRRPGNIIDPSGKILGSHIGIHNYTIGQRRGLKIAMGTRAFVLKIDAEKNEVILTTNEQDLFSNTVIAGDISWTGDVIPELPLRCEGQIRYRSRPSPGTASLLDDGRLQMIFDKPQRAVSPGQALVLFNGDRVLCGGWIESGE